jgi:putative two-component system response regulator
MDSTDSTPARRWRHDLLTPMNHIIGYSEILIEDGATAELPALAGIRDDGRQLLDQINALFDAPGELTGGPGDITQVRALGDRIAAQCAGLLAGLAASGQRQTAQDLLRVHGAAAQLRLLLDQLGHSASGAAPAPASVPAAERLAAARPQEAVEPQPCGPLLVVDDNADNRDMLARRLAKLGYQVDVAADGLLALATMAKVKYDLVLLDVMMPNLDGFGVLTSMKRDPQLLDIPVIMISALQEIDSIARCIELGAEDYLAKPFDPVLLRARVSASLDKRRLRNQEKVYLGRIEEYALHLEELVREQVRDISKAQFGTIFALSNLAESRDTDTGEHLVRVQHYCRALAGALARLPKYAGVIDADYIETLVVASPLHDIGKVGIPDNILQKPGKLTEEEFEVMKRHPVLGAATLLAVANNHDGNAFIRMGIEVVECHHEKWDGTGYPHGLPGDAIPLSARIMALADVYDALRSKRCYKPEFSHETSRAIVLEGRGSHFDPDAVDCFLQIENEFDAIWTRYGA